MLAPFMACQASPNALRRHTVSVGTSARCSACDHAHAPVQHPVVLDLRPTMKPGTSLQEDDRQVEGVAQHDQPDDLVAGLGVEHAGLEHGLVATTPTGQPSMRASAVISVAGEQRLQLEQLRRRRPAGRTTGACRSPGCAARAPARSARGRARAGVAAGRPGRRRPGVGRQVGQPAADGGVGLLVGLHPEVDLAGVAGVDVDAAHSSKVIISPVATSNTRGEVTARHEPRTCTTKSDRADRNDEPPKDWPTMAVAIGTRRRRGWPIVGTLDLRRCPRRRSCRGCGRRRSGRSGRSACPWRGPARRAGRSCGCRRSTTSPAAR